MSQHNDNDAHRDLPWWRFPLAIVLSFAGALAGSSLAGVLVILLTAMTQSGREGLESFGFLWSIGIWVGYTFPPALFINNLRKSHGHPVRKGYYYVALGITLFGLCSSIANSTRRGRVSNDQVPQAPGVELALSGGEVHRGR
jgi:hypothetical protein